MPSTPAGSPASTACTGRAGLCGQRWRRRERVGRRLRGRFLLIGQRRRLGMRATGVEQQDRRPAADQVTHLDPQFADGADAWPGPNAHSRRDEPAGRRYHTPGRRATAQHRCRRFACGAAQRDDSRPHRPLAAALDAHDDVFPHAATFTQNRAVGSWPHGYAAARCGVALPRHRDRAEGRNVHRSEAVGRAPREWLEGCCPALGSPRRCTTSSVGRSTRGSTGVAGQARTSADGTLLWSTRVGGRQERDRGCARGRAMLRLPQPSSCCVPLVGLRSRNGSLRVRARPSGSFVTTDPPPRAGGGEDHDVTATPDCVLVAADAGRVTGCGARCWSVEMPSLGRSGRTSPPRSMGTAAS